MSEPRPQFLTVRVQNTGQVFAVERTPLTIGRLPENVVALPDLQVSRRHATIEWQPGGPVLCDLDSTHGTYVDGRRISGPIVLRPGQIVRMGNAILEVESWGGTAGVGELRPAPAVRRSRMPGWLVVAAVALSLAAGPALLAACGPFQPEAEVAGTGLPLDAQDESAASSTALPGATLGAVAQAETALTSLTATPSPAPSTALPSATPQAAGTPTAAPATLAPTAVPTVTPRAAPTAVPTPVPTPVLEYPAPTLVAPSEDEAQGVQGRVTFVWSYPRPLGDGEGFQVLIWKEGQEHNGAAGLTSETQQTIDLDVVLPGRGGSGDYFWTVVVRRAVPGEPLLSPEADPRRLVYSPREAQPNQCALFDCAPCFSWDAGNPLCSECNC